MLLIVCLDEIVVDDGKSKFDSRKESIETGLEGENEQTETVNVE